MTNIKKSSIYTRKGDLGETDCVGGKRVRKDDRLMNALGEIDELNSLLGLILADRDELRPGIGPILAKIQADLMRFSTDLAFSYSERPSNENITQDDIAELEETIDRFDAALERLKEFLVPGGKRTAAMLHLARTVCRRCERSIISLKDSCETLSPELCGYINRLSDLLFVLARHDNFREK